VPLAAVALLVLNDHVFKARWPGLVTGKLSDVAGLTFFPIVLDALAAVLPGRRAMDRVRRMAACALTTAAVFAAVKTWAPATRAYAIGLGLLQWPFRAAGAVLQGQPPGPPAEAILARDPTDLVALPFAAIPVLLERRRRRR
jgi:hypothetical protein